MSVLTFSVHFLQPTNMKGVLSVCNACHAVDKLFPRCSQCKWVAYCSKSCQKDQWKAGHREMCMILRTCQRFRDLEVQWRKTRPSDEVQTLVIQCGLNPESMSLFGELFFLLCGLKACVLLSNLPPVWRQSFANDVILTSGLLDLAKSVTTDSCSIALYSVGTRLQTPAEYELTGDLVLVNRLHADFDSAQRSLRLAAATLDDENACVRLAAVDLSISGSVEEHQLASALDYPVALSECKDAALMIEVGYILEEGQHRVLLTSYCAMATPQHTQRVQQHFQRYQGCSKGLNLTLQTSQI